jgi:hypothetical protein
MDVIIDEEETTADPTPRKYPDVCGVYIDKRSARGGVYISGAGRAVELLSGPDRKEEEEADVAYEDIKKGQQCIIASATVLFSRPKTKD